MADFGGRIRFSYGGNLLTIRAKVTLESGDFTYDVEHNQNGSFDRYMKPMGPSFDCEFVDSADDVSALPPNWNTIMAGGPYTVNILEDDSNLFHQIATAKFFGRNSSDRLTGKVSGIKIQGPVGSYKVLNGTAAA